MKVVLNQNDIRIIAENVTKRMIKEGLGNDYEWDNEEEQELSAFEEYRQDYNGMDFNVSGEELERFCLNNEFLYIIDTPWRGWRTCAANRRDIQLEIARDIQQYGVEKTHEADKYMEDKPQEFENMYVAIFKVPNTEDGNYYVVYQQER